ncbi:7TM-DISM domain-containing protein [Limnohabitans sp. DCL3]|uniref:sensor histidine kinase n=1 Tax=Limnohabitans sp. DCL3 TaxID=3374103 RepID=UPI003A8496C7
MTFFDVKGRLSDGAQNLGWTFVRQSWRRCRDLAQALGWMIALLVCMHPVAGAAPLPPQHQVTSVNLEPHASLWVDDTGTLTIADVSSPDHANRFKQLQGPLSLGFTPSVVWVRIDLTSAESSQWMLEVGQPILEDVRLYHRSPQGDMQERHGTLSGLNPQRETDYRRPVFQVDLKAGVPEVFYLRLTSRTSMVTNLKLWSPMALFENSNLETFIWGLVFGSYVLVVFFYSAFWIWTREKIHLFYVLYVSTNLGAAFLTGRWNDMLGLQINTHIHTLALGIFVCFSLWIAPVFTAYYLGAHRIWPRTVRVFLRSCTTVSLLCIGLVLMGYYSQGVLAIQVTSIFVIFINIAVSGYLAYKGEKKGQLLLLAFSLFYIGVMWRYLRNIGLIEPSWWNESVYQVGAFMHMMVMSTGIFSSYNALRRKSEQERARADAQERQRERQYEFLGMVSHEVRTPLTVISASADNLMIDASLSVHAKNRASKIIRHTEKLQKLFDTYLNNERLLNGDSAIRMSDINLVALCEALVQDMKDAHGLDIQFSTPIEVSLRCDPDLLRVAISNLLENARKHVPVKSSIALALRRAENKVQIAVTDQGLGVDDRDMPYIFDAYYRGQGAYTSVGSGLGLHLVQFIAQQHHGRVHAQKLQPCGMEFVIEIPVQQPPQESAMTQSFSIT